MNGDGLGVLGEAHVRHCMHFATTHNTEYGCKVVWRNGFGGVVDYRAAQAVGMAEVAWARR